MILFSCRLLPLGTILLSLSLLVPLSTPFFIDNWTTTLRVRRNNHHRQDDEITTTFMVAESSMLSLSSIAVSSGTTSNSSIFNAHPLYKFSAETSKTPARTIKKDEKDNCQSLTSSSSSSSSPQPPQPQSSSSSSSSLPPQPPFFVRRALPADVGPASKILTDGFFKGKTNFFGYHYERLLTYLSLESSFLVPNTDQILFVACDVQSGTVWGVVELDTQQLTASTSKSVSALPSGMMISSTSATGVINDDDGGTIGRRSEEGVRPLLSPIIITGSDGPYYMCNLAVDEKYQRLGIASALVRACERQVWSMVEQQQQQQQQEEKMGRYSRSSGLVDSLSSSSSSSSYYSMGVTTTNTNNSTAVIQRTESSSSSTTTTTRDGVRIRNVLSLKVRMSNEAAISLYTKLGYKRTGQEIEAKTGETILQMWKDLS